MKHWWQESVVYQIYPRSFCDSNGDGIGDLRGIIQKLEYLAYLGVDVIWLCPVYASPNEDNGYDVSDYTAIHPDFGTMEDMDELIDKAREHGIKIIMDIIANHTSDQHPWFIEAGKSRDSIYRDYYVFRPDQGGLPSDLQSIFLGPAWDKHPRLGDYYLHLFAKSQPDLNWHHPEVRENINGILNFWLDKGIGGFRFDVIDLIAKEIDKGIIADGPKLHEYIQEMNRKSFGQHDVLTVGETWGATVEKAKKYSNPDGSEFSMIFNFSHILLDSLPGKEKWDYIDLDLLKLKNVFDQQQTQLYQAGWNSLFWNNHDLPRIVSRWGNDQEYRVQCAKMLGILLHFMQGTPYIYQGEELGMTNVRFDDFADYRDIETKNMIDQRRKAGYSEESIRNAIWKIGRDNARTPMQWDATRNAGFTTGEPWIKLNPNYPEINVASQIDDEESVLQLMRKLIWYRKESELKTLIRDGSFNLILTQHPDIFAYQRTYSGEQLTVICNFHGNDCSLDLDTTNWVRILGNYSGKDAEIGLHLRPYEAVVFRGEVGQKTGLRD